MNQVSPFPDLPPVPSFSTERINDVIRDHSRRLREQIAKHRLASFPPTSAKTFRRLTPAEVARILGVSDDYLRQMAAAVCAPPDPEQSRRTYTLDDLARLRQAMAERSRTPLKFLPHRQGNEHMQCICVVNFKGGSAKTTTAANLTQYLALNGYRTLAVDLDPQASLTTLFGIAPETAVGPNESLYGTIRYDNDRVPTETVIRRTYIPSLDLIPAALELMEFEHETPRALINRAPTDFLNRIDESLCSVEHRYDVAVLDCPPQLGYLTMAALMAASSVLVTVHPQMLDIMSMAQFLGMLSDILDVIAESPNKPSMGFDWHRYLITRYEATDGPQNQMALFLRAMYGGYVLNNATLKSTAISDAGLTSQTIYEVERSQFTRGTYDRAIDSVNAVNEEIVGLIRSAWGRS
jgi:chromosome partitioning protein